MCLVSTPKINTTAPPVQYMHNTFLDGVSDGEGLTIGRNSLRIDLTNQDESNGLATPAGSTATSGSGLNTPTSPPQQTPGDMPRPAAALAQQAPGMVIPTIGGSMAGSVPANVTVAAAK